MFSECKPSSMVETSFGALRPRLEKYMRNMKQYREDEWDEAKKLRIARIASRNQEIKDSWWRRRLFEITPINSVTVEEWLGMPNPNATSDDDKYKNIGTDYIWCSPYYEIFKSVHPIDEQIRKLYTQAQNRSERIFIPIEIDHRISRVEDWYK